MRILNVTETYSPFFEFGGPPVKVRALSQGLAQRGHEVTVLSADWGLESRLTAEGGGDAARVVDRSPFGWRINENGVQCIYLPTWFRYRALTWNPAVKRYCRARLKNNEVVHIFGLYDLLGPAVAAHCRAGQVPYVVEPIGMFVPMVRNILAKRIYHVSLGRRMLAGASAIVATSAQEVEELASGGVPREKIVLRRNGVEIPSMWPRPGAFRASQGIAPEAKLILFLGRLSLKKSPELLLQAFAELAGQSAEKSSKLVFAGPDDEGLMEKLQALASHLGVSSRVQFSGPLFGEKKWAAYRDADVFVLPSRNENFGNTAAESVAAGTPVIITEDCGIAPLLANIAGLVVEHDSRALSAALTRILSEPQLHARLSSGCAAVSAQLGWDAPVQDTEKLYQTLTARAA
ncbi:MAG: glycosyltransferase [Candidatus Acidiferrum sp.]